MLKIKKLNWDSDFFGFGIAQLDEQEEKLTSLENLDDFVKSNNIKLVQSLVDIKNIKFIELLENSGFHYVDTRVDFLMDLNKTNSTIDFEIATIKDITDVVKIADKLYVLSRFYNSFFSEERANKLFKLWAEKAVKGEFDNICLKSSDDLTGEVNGFVTIKYINNTEARIGLIGVSKNHLGKGIGTKLINSAVSFLKEKEYEKLYIATQGKNLGALNLYIKSGFKIKSLHNWFYKIFEW
ncbi:MAG: GNAT family N-acetyltransferase [Candidatus Kapabacteria bacterium]|nr:GNAT family N-acetyltransferase [Candidatus Kapabacteria bacterium]